MASFEQLAKCMRFQKFSVTKQKFASTSSHFVISSALLKVFFSYQSNFGTKVHSMRQPLNERMTHEITTEVGSNKHMRRFEEVESFTELRKKSSLQGDPKRNFTSKSVTSSLKSNVIAQCLASQFRTSACSFQAMITIRKPASKKISKPRILILSEIIATIFQPTF